MLFMKKIAEVKLIRDGNDIFAIVTFDPAKNPFIMFDIYEDLGYWYFNPMFLMPGFNSNINNIRVDYIALDILDKEQRIKEPEAVEFMRLSRYFKAEEAYAKKNQTTDNGSN